MFPKEQTNVIRILQEHNGRKRWSRVEMGQLEPGDVIRFYSRKGELISDPSGSYEYRVMEQPSISVESTKPFDLRMYACQKPAGDTT